MNDYSSPVYPSRLERIASQLERLEKNAAVWEPQQTPESAPRRSVQKSARTAFPQGSGQERSAVPSPLDWWEMALNRVKVKPWGGTLRELAEEMARKSKDPFTGRTRQISVLCAFIPFVCSILGAGIRFVPQMPYLSFWEKMTYFIVFPIFFSVAGAFVGFIIGVMLDTLERQMEQKEIGGMLQGGVPLPEDSSGPSTQKMIVWVDVDDLEENQRVAETVTGEDGTPILLRHTVLKPSHIQMLKEQNIDKIKIELVKYPTGGDLALVG